MIDLKLVRFCDPDEKACVGLQIADTIYDLSDTVSSLSDWLRESVGHVENAIGALETLAQNASRTFEVADLAAPAPGKPRLLAPIDEAEVWAAGVTYEISRDARQEESEDGGDVYARVYNAERPEIFFKAQGWRVVGPGDEVGIRSDATWSVPEPELGIVFNPALEVVGFTIGNDMSSRDIEGANPLYLPQAKVYTASCSLGPGILLNPTSEWPDVTIRIRIERDGTAAFEGDVHTSRIKRNITELGQYLGHSYTFPNGAVLLTGTGTVPAADFTLAAGDVVTINIDSIGQLVNTVKVV